MVTPRYILQEQRHRGVYLHVEVLEALPVNDRLKTPVGRKMRTMKRAEKKGVKAEVRGPLAWGSG